MLKQQEAQSELFRGLLATVREPLLVLDAGMRVRLANQSFYHSFQVTQEETVGRLLFDLGNGQWDIPRLRELLEVILPDHNHFESFEVDHEFPHLGWRTMLLNAREIESQDLILLAIEDVTERHVAEARGRDAAEKYRLLVDSVTDYAISMLDKDGNVKTWNESCERVQGWKAEEVLGHYFGIFYTPEDREDGKPEREIATAKEKGGYKAEDVRVRADGSRYWARVSLTPIRREGELVGFAKVLQNIDCRKQAELLTKAITDNASTAVFVMDPEGRCTFMNPAAEAMTGFSFAEIKGRFLHDQIHHTRPDGTPIPRESCPITRHLRDQPSVRNHEDFLVRKDGTFLPVRCAASPIRKDGTLTGVVLEVQDVSEQKRAEDALRASEERLRLALTAGRMVAYDYDPAADVLEIQETAREVFGLSPGTTLTTRHERYALIHPDDRPNQRRIVDQAVAAGSGYRSQYRMVRPDNGAVVWMEERGYALRNASGETTRLVGVIQDITEQKTIKAELEEANRRKDEFLAMLAHELRNPLAAILTGIQLIKMTRPPQAPVQKALDRMYRQANTLVRLVDDLTDMSRVSRGKINLQKEEVSLKHVVEQAVDSVQHHLHARAQTLHRDVADNLRFRADPVRLQQVVGNLLNNASKYGRANGNIWLECRREGDHAVVVVRDDGRGFSPSLRDRIFDVFVQENPSPQTGGLGIGLTLVRSLVRLHGGTVVARSGGAGQGAEFEVRLPMVPGAAGAGHPAPEPNGGRLRVLIVDDNVDQADNLAALLEMDGYQVRVTYRGEEGIKEITQWRPDVVLLDIGMPHMSGYEVIAELPKDHRPFVVAVTGYGQPGDRERTREAGFDEHLVKPVRLETLQEVLGRVRSKN